MDDLSKSLESYKNAFNKKLVNFTLELPILDGPLITQKEATVKNELANLESENKITALDSPINKLNIEEKPKENDKIKQDLGTENAVVAATYIPEDRTTVDVEERLTNPKTNDLDTQSPRLPEPQPPQPSTPPPPPALIKRHILHRVITSTGARFSLALILLLLLYIITLKA